MSAMAPTSSASADSLSNDASYSLIIDRAATRGEDRIDANLLNRMVFVVVRSSKAKNRRYVSILD